jgi:hypothetical protein
MYISPCADDRFPSGRSEDRLIPCRHDRADPLPINPKSAQRNGHNSGHRRREGIHDSSTVSPSHLGLNSCLRSSHSLALPAQRPSEPWDDPFHPDPRVRYNQPDQSDIRSGRLDGSGTYRMRHKVEAELGGREARDGSSSRLGDESVYEDMGEDKGDEEVAGDNGDGEWGEAAGSESYQETFGG